MEIQAKAVGVTGPHGPLLRPTSLRVAPGQVALVTGEPGAGHTVLALTLAGRMRPHEGAVLLDGRTNESGLRAGVAVVDAPGVTEPEGSLRLRDVIGEELAMAGAPANRRAVREWLAERGCEQHADSRFETVPSTARTRLLVESAATRPGVGVLVMDCPDRHTDDPHAWWALARQQAELGLAVVALCTETSSRLLGIPAARLGSQEQPPPLAVHVRHGKHEAQEMAQ
ncbi:ATP-binding cassette domain-containing protein [Allokutzneria oryzae]|uniref:ATP-binding cassette domain-containing protein n=1 Tax=Allokutzneria oryzae TaxID=1378989 RepID=A0ABV6A617_9PSEU